MLSNYTQRNTIVFYSVLKMAFVIAVATPTLLSSGLIKKISGPDYSESL